MNTFGFTRTTPCRRRMFPAPTRECAGGMVPGFPDAAGAAIPSAGFSGLPSTLTPRRFPVQRLFFALFLALALLLASLPARAGETTPLVAGQPGGLLGVVVALLLLCLVRLGQNALAAARVRVRRGGN